VCVCVCVCVLEIDIERAKERVGACKACFSYGCILENRKFVFLRQLHNLFLK